MIRRNIELFFLLLGPTCFAQEIAIHPNAHAHNDYEHARPLKEALENGFLSVEDDVHLRNGTLVVAHNFTTSHSPSFERLYLRPLDSLLRIHNGFVYANEQKTFFLMIDIKTEAEATYIALSKLFDKYQSLNCNAVNCPVKIFLSGERPLSTMAREGYAGVGIDGRPDDLGKGYASDLMPVISDTYKNWSGWNGNSAPAGKDLQRIRELAQRVHAEGKRLRLWAIPDNEVGWGALLNAGV